MDLLQPEQIDAYRRDGFIHLPGLLDPDEIARLGSEVDRAVAARTRDDHRPLADKSPYEQSFIQCMCLWEDFPEVGRLTFHPRIAQAAAELMAVERVRLWHDQALYKEAGGRETETHQDHPYWPIAESDTISVWIPLMEIDQSNGCMGYVPGSHRGEVHFVDIFNSKSDDRKVLEAQQTRPPVWVPCGPGDVIFHHGFTVHMARPNPTDRPRRVHTAIYFKDGCTRSRDAFHPCVDRDHIAVGAPIDGLATPMAWPLPGGELPRPGTWAALNPSRVIKYATVRGVFPDSAPRE